MTSPRETGRLCKIAQSVTLNEKIMNLKIKVLRDIQYIYKAHISLMWHIFDNLFCPTSAKRGQLQHPHALLLQKSLH